MRSISEEMSCHKGNFFCSRIYPGEWIAEKRWMVLASLLRAKVRRIPAANDLESLQCVHICIQKTRSDPTVQGHCEAGRIPGGPVLTIVLAHGDLAWQVFLDGTDARWNRQLRRLAKLPAGSRMGQCIRRSVVLSSNMGN
jgi:hypothetical protein